MTRHPTIIHLRPDEAESRRRKASQHRLRAYVQGVIASAVQGCDFARPADLGREFIDGGARIVEAAPDGPGAASALGASCGRISPSLPHSPPKREADRHFGGGQR